MSHLRRPYVWMSMSEYVWRHPSHLGTSEPALKCYRIYFLSLPRKALSCIVSSLPGVYHIKTDGTVTGPYFIVSRYCNQMVLLFDSEPCCFYSVHSRFLFSEFIFYPFSLRVQCLYYSGFNNYIAILRHTSYGDIFNEYTSLNTVLVLSFV